MSNCSSDLLSIFIHLEYWSLNYERHNQINRTMVMKKIWYMALMSVNEKIALWNQCVQHVIWVEEVLGYGVLGSRKISITKGYVCISIKEYEYSDASCLINLCCFRNTSPSILLNLVLYWAVNNIMAGFDFIQLGIILQYIPTLLRYRVIINFLRPLP